MLFTDIEAASAIFAALVALRGKSSHLQYQVFQQGLCDRKYTPENVGRAKFIIRSLTMRSSTDRHIYPRSRLPASSHCLHSMAIESDIPAILPEFVAVLEQLSTW